MKQILLLLISIIFYIPLLAQPFRYTETIFEKSDTLLNVEYARADWLNNPIGGLLADFSAHEGEMITEERPLYMDIFQPHGDTVSKRPAILLTHSGGFILGSRHNEDMLALCDSFARRGYVTATMDYRLGMAATVTRFFGIMVGLSVSEENGYRSVYRAVQDGRAAVRFLKHNAENFGIDTTNIFMVGSSAGAFVTLQNLYLDKPSEIPPAVLKEPSLGNLDTVGIQGYGSQANAAVAMWGAIESPELIEDKNTPVLLIHGTADDVVPFKKGMPLKSLVPDNDAISFEIPETYGSYCIDTALNKRNIYHEKYFVKGAGHEFYGVATGAFGDDGANAYYDTIQNKIGNFLLDRFRPECKFEYSINGLELQLTNTSNNINKSIWEFSEGEIKYGNPITTSFSAPGNYTIKLTTCNENMACDTLSKSIKLGTPVEIETNRINKISLYPNPVKDKLYIEGIKDPIAIKIYDITGNQVFIQNNYYSDFLGLNFLKNGIYILKIQSENLNTIHRFVKQD